jgi:proteasome lid subunit RPN8/RPN11
MTLKIKKTHLNEIFEEAKKKYPIEACGILAGKKHDSEAVVEKVYHAKNILNSTSAYRIDPADQIKAFQEAEIEGLEIIGFYHSHPFWEPYWSKEHEEKGKAWINYLHVIVSLKDNMVKVYRKKEIGVEEEKFIMF